MPSKELFAGNRERLRKLLKPKSMVVLHANDILPTNADGVMGFIQNSDLLHLSGVDQEETVLVLVPGAVEEKDREILFVRETSEEIAIWEGEKLTKEAAKKVSGINRVEWTTAFPQLLRRFALEVDHIYLATNEHLRADVTVQTRNDRFIRECMEKFPLHRYERLAPLMHQIRLIKQPEEIAMLRKACEITREGFERVLKFIRPGVGEWEIEAELAHDYIRRGSRGFAYPPIIGSGGNACVLHYVENKDRCESGQLVLMDAAAEYGGWNADLTRTVPVNGRYTVRQKDVYNAVLRVLRGSNEILRPGNSASNYYKQVVELMEEELVGLGLFSKAEAKAQGEDKPLVKNYFMHGVSHHLGIDVHDVHPPNDVFEEGTVFTIEPGIYLREEGFGVRLENDVVIGVERNVDLMEDIPIEAEEIEEIMNR